MLNKILAVFLLAGCSGSVTPVETVTKDAIRDAKQALDYADNNIADTPDTMFLKAHLEACTTALVGCETIANTSDELHKKEIKNHELLLVIVAVLSFVLGRVIKV